MEGLSERRRRLIGRLRGRRTRAREGLVLVEGIRAVSDLLEAGVRPRFAVVAPRAEVRPPPWHGGWALVIGSEGHGVRDEVQAAAARTVRVPMDAGVESLNAAVAGSILLYELTRHSGGHGG